MPLEWKTTRRRLATVVTAVVLMFLAACATNPATGKRQLSLIGEQQEIAMGREAAQSALQQYGRYPDDELQSYVAEVGDRLAAASEKPELPWTFTVVDDPTVNAFALPGGQIFVTRGILSHFNSEAELASVLGHEIGHVTGRHSVEQMSRAQLANLGLGVAMIASEDIRPYAGIASQGLGLMFLKFGRDDESESDQLGLRYMTQAGYDPNEMPKMFVTLGRISDQQEGGRIPVWASTHPDPGNREQTTYDRIASLPPDRRTGTVNRDGYLRRIDGIVFGENPREGYFIGSGFYHPELAFRIDFPEGWQTMNTRQFVAAISPGEDAIVQLTLASANSADQATSEFFSSGAVERGPVWGRRFYNFRTVPTSDRPTVVRGLVGFLEQDGRVYRLVSYTPDGKFSGYESVMKNSLASFARITDDRYLDVTPKTLEIMELPETMTVSEFNRRFPSTVDDATLAIVNGTEPNGTLDAGSLVKRVVGGKLPER
jgi:predicted Zn-dependent protease